MSVECFRRRRFREPSLRLITLLSSIASDYAAGGMKLTVRQLYYQCVARDWIENNEREYQRIIRLLTDAREAGLFDWAAIEDRGREVVMRTCWRSPAEILEAAASSYHEDRWELQDVRVVVVLEKSALAGIVEPVCKDLDTPLPRICRSERTLPVAAAGTVPPVKAPVTAASIIEMVLFLLMLRSSVMYGDLLPIPDLYRSLAMMPQEWGRGAR